MFKKICDVLKSMLSIEPEKCGPSGLTSQEEFVLSMTSNEWRDWMAVLTDCKGRVKGYRNFDKIIKKLEVKGFINLQQITDGRKPKTQIRRAQAN